MLTYEQLSVSDGTGEAVLANIESNRSIGAVTIDVDSVENFPNEFIFCTGDKNANNFIVPSSMTIGIGHLDSGNVIIDDFAPGYVDDGNTSGQILIIKPTTHWADEIVRLARVAHNDDGTLKQSQLGDGWLDIDATLSVASGYNQGNKSFIVDSDEDLTGVLSPGMRFSVERGTAPPTQVLDLESSSSQYADDSSVSGWSFTDDITTEVLMNLESYPPNDVVIVGRGNGTTTGFFLFVDVDGTVVLMGLNTNYRRVRSKTSVPVGRDVHIAVTLNLSANTGTVYFDGIAQPSVMQDSGAVTSFTNSGTLIVGRYPGGDYLDAKLSELRVWSVVRTQTEIRDNMYKQLVGNESNLAGYWKFDGNLNDSTANNNNLTAGGSAGFSTYSFFKEVEMGIITKVTATQIYVFGGTDFSVPNMTLEAPRYSTQKAPLGFPASRNKWFVEMLDNGGNWSQAAPANGTWYNAYFTTFPVGAWDVGWWCDISSSANASHQFRARGTLSKANNTEDDVELTAYQSLNFASGGVGIGLTIPMSMQKLITVEVATIYYLNFGTVVASMGTLLTSGNTPTKVRAVCAYV